MMRIPVKTLTRDSFAPWGQFVSAADTSGLKQLSVANYMGNLAVAEVGEKTSISILNPIKRDFTLKSMEQHQKTHEICIAIREDCIIAVTRDLGGNPDPSGLEAFLLKEGDTVIYAPGVWHWVPFAAGNGDCRQLIIYRDQTGSLDFFKKELPETAELAV